MLSKKKRCSLRSIAQDVGLSTTTVYQILNNKNNSMISEDTRERVLQVAEAVAYRPNIGYKLMRGEENHIVAILVSSEQLRYREPISNMIISIVNSLGSQGYVTYLCVMQYSSEKNLQAVRKLYARGTKHFIMLGNVVGYDLIEEEIEKTQCNLIGYCDTLKRKITNEFVTAQAEVLRFFLDRGHRQIKCILPEEAVYSMYGRLDALKAVFCNASEEHLVKDYIYSFPNIDYSNSAVLFECEFQSGFDITAELMQKYPKTDALFFSNDNVALGGAKYLMQNGYIVGKDVLIAGFYNLTAAQFSCCPITSIAYDIQRVQEKLLKYVFNNEPCNESVPCITYIRE